MEDRYDLIVVGAGSAGLAAASFAARLGVRVALIERDRVGGDCTWSGCVPSKALLHAARVAQLVRRAEAVGLQRVERSLDLERVMAQVQAAVARVYAFETPAALARDGIEVVEGAARFLDPHAVEVAGRVLRARRFIVCTGAQPAIPPIPGLAEAPYLTYADVFTLRALPKHLLVLGGGPIGVELGQAFQRLGSAVTLLEQAERILPIADPEASAALAEQLVDEGVQLRTGAAVARVEPRAGAIAVAVGDAEHVGDALLVAVGRRPNVAGLGLERAGVEHTGKGIPVDARLRTNQKHIYACGDVTGALQFTHHAAWQGFVAARNALLPGSSRGSPDAVPWVVFTEPEVAQVGLTEQEARERWGAVLVARWPIERVDRAQTAGEQRGLLKLVARQSGKLVGATMVASAGGELINELALALERGLTLSDLASTMHAYPTYGFGIQQASAEAMLKRLTHGWRGRLLGALARWWP
ncbi:MAG: FAD-dependent oxidoreductase [Chloroflexi bacterium]|nr:FAD-dependent oxidoreductase [Chloroflexota bacterium]